MGKTLDFLRGRKVAYCRVFNKEDEAAKEVMQDLAKFCRANKSTFHEDGRAHALLEGRREVWLRIQQHIGLTEDELMELYGGR